MVEVRGGVKGVEIGNLKWMAEMEKRGLLVWRRGEMS